MRMETANSFLDFVKQCEFIDILTDVYVFRGQPVQGNLVPNIARNQLDSNFISKEQQLIEQLKLLGASFIEPAYQTDLDLLVLAQHFGLFTRLLDWTTNPLTALWFACADKSPGDVYVYAMEAHHLLIKDVYSKDPFKPIKTRAFQPRFNNPRITAQQGWFTLHQFSKKKAKFVPLERNPDIKKYLHEICIPSKIREDILKTLDRHGISARTLLPDLGGLCQYLNWKNNTT